MIIAELEGCLVEVYRTYRCEANPRKRHFQFRILDDPPRIFGPHGFRKGDNTWECCRTGRFKNWRRQKARD